MYIILQQNISISNFIVMALKTTGVACFLEEGRRINVYLFLAVWRAWGKFRLNFTLQTKTIQD